MSPRADGLRRDRDGELVPDVEVTSGRACPTSCRHGWIGEDEAGRPRPCPVCKARLLGPRPPLPPAAPPPPELQALIEARRAQRARLAGQRAPDPPPPPPDAA